MLADQIRFLGRLIARPSQVGAVAPSSPGLARAMAAQIDAASEGPVLELGPGTGVVTAALIARGIALSDDAARALLERAGVPDLDLDAVASALPYGDQRRLEIARALAAQPSILMLDEPAAGMNPTETAHLVDTIRTLAKSGIGILLIEHDMTLVRAACDNVVVLNFGEVLARGTPHEVAQDPAVVEAYLGTSAESA